MQDGNAEAVQPEAATGEGPEAEEQEEGEGEETSPENPERPRKRKTLQDRLDKLTAEKYATRSEADQAKARAAQLEQEIAQLRQQAAAPKPSATDSTEKTIEDFDFDNAKFTRYLAQEEAKRIIAEEKDGERQRTQQAKQQEAIGKFKSREASLTVERPDYLEVAYKNPLAQFYPQDLADFLYESDKGPELAYHLGQNLAETDAILHMEPRQRDRALSRIEASLIGPRTAQPKTQTQAPAPVRSLQGSASVGKSLDDMPMAEFAAKRNQEIAAKRKQR
jgi:hypothetical protein